VDSEQRKSFRILVPDGQEKAVLKVGRRCITVRIVDSSAGGFALATCEMLRVKRGDVLRLRTIAGWHEVRVVRDELFSDGVLIGVERLGDIEDPRQVQSGWLDSILLPSGQPAVRGTTAARLFVVGALAGAILAGFVWLVVHDRGSRADARILPPAANQMVTDIASQAHKVAEKIRGGSPDNAPPRLHDTWPPQ
jgi:hypothetical protein